MIFVQKNAEPPAQGCDHQGCSCFHWIVYGARSNRKAGIEFFEEKHYLDGFVLPVRADKAFKQERS